MNNSLLDYLKHRNISFEINKELKNISFIKIGGIAPLLIYPATGTELVDIIGFLKNGNYRYKIIGRTSNILFTDASSDYIFVSTKNLVKLDINGNTVIAECGITLPSLYRFLQSAEIGGAEELSGIPGTIGGAIISNAGAYGREISELITSVSVYSPEKNKVLDISLDKCNFSYRSSLFTDSDYVVLSAVMSFERMPAKISRQRVIEYRRKRWSLQPYDKLSLGSTFKRVNGVSAGYYIDKCGLKGKRIGDAEISEKHAGFIINNGEASALDYLSLMQLASDEVEKKFSVVLTPEIVII